MVFYRKYRPQTIEELDSLQIRENITNLIESNRLPHAFLFTGPRGLGKTSTARILAKAINCKSKKKNSIEPCNSCSVCKSITNGSSIDVMEIDAASNRGIDEIRDLRDKIKLAPVESEYKVYIIDEVHMLTTEAFNALLKTLEEPPINVIFILATTEPQKIPNTILSRCTHIVFSRATDEELVRSFERIANGENIKISKKVLEKIAKLSDGGFRDGAKILEELSLKSKNNQITEEDLENNYRQVNIDKLVATFFELLVDKNIKDSIKLVESLHANGIDVEFFTKRFIEALHEVLLGVYGIESQKQFGLENIKLNIEEINKIYDLFSESYIQIRQSVVQSLPLELSIVEWCTGEVLEVSLDNSTEKKIEQVIGHKPSDIDKLRKENGKQLKDNALNGSEPKKKSVRFDKSKFSLLVYDSKGDHKPEWFDEFWDEFIVSMKSYNHTVSGVLRGCTLSSLTKDSMVIRTSYKFHKDKLSEPNTINALEKTAETLTGKKIVVSVELVV